MSNQSPPALELSPLEAAARAALATLEKLMPPGMRYVLVVAMPDDEEAGVYANVDRDGIVATLESLSNIYDVEVEQ